MLTSENFEHDQLNFAFIIESEFASMTAFMVLGQADSIL